jgi:uncharacterized protein (DUF58 family)
MTIGQTRLRFGFTDAGKMLLRGAIYITLAALIVPAFGALAILASVMLTALVLGFVLRPRVSVSGNVPEHILAGQTVSLTYRLKNTGRLPTYNLHLQLQGLPKTIEVGGDVPVISRLRPGETAEASLTIRPERRGCYRSGRRFASRAFLQPVSFLYCPAEPETWIVLPPLFRLQVRCAASAGMSQTSGLRPSVRTGAHRSTSGIAPS